MDRRFWKIWGLSAFVIVAAFLVTYQFVEPAPPRHLTLGTGGEGGAYQKFGERYRAILAREGVELTLRPSSGAVENIDRLSSETPDLDVAFVQGGVSGDPPVEGLEAIASMFLEPLWIFVADPETTIWLRDLAGKRLAIGAKGSGTRAVALELLGANGVTDANAELLDIGGSEAAAALQDGAIDALFTVASPNADVVRTLLKTPDIRLMTIERAGAYRQNYRFLEIVKLAEGAIDLAGNRPPEDVTLLAPVASLVAREGIHPTLVDLLLLAANEVHRRGDLFSERGDFPSSDHLEFPMNQEARRYLSSGPPLLQLHLPFRLASFLDRMSIMLIPLLTLLIPLVRILPPVLDWRIRRRIYRWYDELITVETSAATIVNADQRRSLLARLDEIESKLMNLSVPRHRSDLVINLRAHTKMIRDRLMGQAPGMHDR